MLKVRGRGPRGVVVGGLAALWVAGTLQATEYPGAIPGGFSVGDQGQGVYSVPIAAPAGTGGLSPNLALTYNHLAGNGLAGMRVTLSGFSSISRCQQTYAQEGQVVAVNYDANDRFCLDGQRLVGISGTYGSNGAEYRTEIESFQRIKSLGTAGSGPQYFTVEHGNGSISYFGLSGQENYSYDSRIEKVGSSSVRIWYLSFTEDQFGNRIEYTYSENGTTGEAYPTGVAWTRRYASPSLSPRYGVTITYADRPASDQRSGRDSGGAVWAMTKRISSIEVLYNGSSEIAQYDLAYATNSVTGRSQLDTVTLSRTTGGGTDTLPETIFTWQDGSVGWGSATDTSKTAGSAPLIGDFNNDGNLDIFGALSNKWQVYPGTDSGNLGTAIDSGQSSTTSPHLARVLDFDGDGDSDLLYPSGSTWYVLKSNGTTWASPTSTSISTSTATHALIQDFDGDGLDDWLYLDASYNVKWYRNQGGSFAGAATLLTSVAGFQNASANVPPADFNGDGRNDLMYGTVTGCPSFCTFNGYVALAQGSGYTPLTSFYSASYGGGPFPVQDGRVVDINGDGLDDLMYALTSTNTWWVRLSNGSAGLGSASNTGISSSGYASSMVADYNNDGLSDYLRYASGNYYVHLSTGTTLSSSATTSFAAEGSLVGDISGDGFSELAYVSDGTWWIRNHQTALPDVVTSFENGLGHETAVTYQTLSQTIGEHYFTGESSPTGPYVQEFNGARPVVTEVWAEDGIGGSRGVAYGYGSAFVDRSGRGWLSFAWKVVRDLSAGIDSSTWYRQDFPLAGATDLVHLRRVSDYQTFRESDPTWEATPTTTPTLDIHFIRIETTTSKEWEIGGTDDGDLIRTVVDNPTFNTTYGYVEDRTVTTTDPTGSYTWTTYTDYNPSPDTDDWCLGLPGQIVTTNSKPDSTYATRSLTHSWNESDCSLASTIDDSESSTAKQLKTSFTYDGYGNPNVVSTDSVDSSAQNRSVTYGYDDWGQFVTSETVGTVGLATTRTWDYVNSQPASVTGADGLTVSYTYDSFGRLASEDTPGIDTTFSYVACVGCYTGLDVYNVEAAHSDGSYTYEDFDELNRPVLRTWMVRGGTTAYEQTDYDALGQVARVSRPYFYGATKYWVDYTYDLIGRVIEEDAPVSESSPSGAITTTQYLGESVWVTDAEGHTTQTEMNAVGQIVKVTDADNKSATYTYKPFGELASMTDAESNMTTVSYDPRGFKSAMSDPNMGDWDYVYNIYGELASQTNALEQTTTLTFDEAGRLYQRSEAEGPTTWSYYTSGAGNLGKVSQISAPNSYTEYFWYDATTGQPSQHQRVIDSVTYQYDMDYDGYGRLEYLEYPTSTSGYRFKLQYQYDAYGHLQYVKDSNESYTYYALHSTDALGRPTTVELGNGLWEDRDYDEAAGYLKNLQTSASVQNLTMTYDEVGNVLSRYDSLINKTEDFTYDSVNRLTNTYIAGVSDIDIEYSPAGRITSKTGIGSYTYGAGSAGPFAVTSANSVNYTYDANGRMITRGSGEIDWYSYDLPSKIDDLTDTSYAQFWYGPDRSRIKQYQSSGVTIRYAGTLFEFEDAATDTYRHYVQAGDKVIAVVERVATTNTRQYLHRDHQGSVVKVTNASGTVDQALAFDAWGLRRNASDWSALGSPFAGSHETERGYTGHEHLDQVGLIHMNGRVQDPILGRFISADPFVQAPFNTQSHNRYSYVWNNPVSLTDPSGFCSAGLIGIPEAHLYCNGESLHDQIEYAHHILFELRKQWAMGGPDNLELRSQVSGLLGGLYIQEGLERMLERGRVEIRDSGSVGQPSDESAQASAENRAALEGEIAALVKSGVITDNDVFRTQDAAARAILNIVTPLSARYGFEVGGNIEEFRLRSGSTAFRYTIPEVGNISSILVSTHAAGYHTHPSGNPNFSNPRHSGGELDMSDTEWVRNSRQALYVGAMLNATTVGVSACERPACSFPLLDYDDSLGTPGRIVP